MENNEKQKTEEKEETKEEVKPLSIVEEARNIRDEIDKAKASLKEENDRKEKLQAEELLGSSAGGHIEHAKPKEETPAEYAKRVMSGGLNAEPRE